jgi:hypothetical protein
MQMIKFTHGLVVVATGLMNALLGPAAAASDYAYFPDALSTIQVLGSTNASGPNGYTIECRAFVLPLQPASTPAFPATFFFEHTGSVKHRWLGILAGMPTGMAVGDGAYWPAAHLVSADRQVNDAAWHHIAYVFKDDSEALYVDGVQVASRSGRGLPISGCCGAQIGAGIMNDGYGSTSAFRGYLDWIRVSSTARYSGPTFQVPLESHLTTDAATELLVTFDGTSASEAFRDLSSKHFELRPGQGLPNAKSPLLDSDCNQDGVPDSWQIQSGALDDDNGNSIPDVCETSVAGVTPPSVPAQGGATVTIKGANFPQNPTVLIGGLPATDVVRLSATRLTATSPALLPGMASISVNGFTLPEALYIRPECGSDLDQNGTVDAGDISIILLDFGPCYQAPLAAPTPEVPPLLDAQAPPDAPRHR